MTVIVMEDSSLSLIWQAIKDICFPPVCLSCGAPLAGTGRGREAGVLLCPGCLAAVSLLTGPLCRCCGIPFPDAAGGDHLCGVCLGQGWHFSLARAVVRYHDPMARIIQAFKYQEQTTALPAFAFLKERLAHLKDMADPDLIIPVPLHRQRLRGRGFNQALLLARAFYPDQKGKIDCHSLRRHRPTLAQTGLSAAARRKNIRGAFQVAGARVAGKKVLLIDDVFTTGTTVDECSRVLRRAGANEVQVLTLARAIRA